MFRFSLTVKTLAVREMEKVTRLASAQGLPQFAEMRALLMVRDAAMKLQLDEQRRRDDEERRARFEKM